MVPSVVPATVEHIPALVADMRPADIAEMNALGYKDMEQCYRHSLEISDEAFTGMLDGEPVVMFGVSTASIMANTARPWLLGTSRLDQKAVAMIFLRRCHNYLSIWMNTYNHLYNCVHAPNKKAIQWLSWLGFEFGSPIILNGHQFLQFSKSRGDSCAIQH